MDTKANLKKKLFGLKMQMPIIGKINQNLKEMLEEYMSTMEKL